MPIRKERSLRRYAPWGMAGLVIFLVVLCYWPALHGALLWDDPAHVTRPELRSWNGLWRIWTELLATQQYYPVLHTAFWIEQRLWGDATLGYHLVNILQHAAASCLLALVLRRLWSMPRIAPTVGGKPGPSRTLPAGAEWIAAGVFAVHPVCVESVAWISEQKNTLSLLLYLVAAYLYLGFAERRRTGLYMAATVGFVLALGTKTVTATLPAALLVVLWWRHGALSWKRDVVPLLPWFGLALAAGLSTAWIERNLIGATGSEYELSLLERTLLAGRIVWFYLGSAVWPAGLAFFYPRWDVPAAAPGWSVHLAGAVAVTIALWALRGRSRGPLAVWLLFVGTLFPALGFFNVFPFAFSYVADHFQYHALAFFVAGVTAGAAVWLQHQRTALRVAGQCVAALAIVVMAVIARGQSGHYLDNETLSRASIASVPDNWMAHHLLAHTLAEKTGADAEAISHYETALRLNPASPDSHHGLGILLARVPGRQEEARQHFERAIQLRPDFAEAHYLLAWQIRHDPARLHEVIRHCEIAIATKPDLADARLLLAEALMQLPARLPEAMAQFEEALYLRPDSAGAHFRYANALARLPGKMPDAIRHFEAALRLNPRLAPAHAQLGHAYAAMPGREGDAVRHFETALQLDPGRPREHYYLALLLADLPGREADALRHAREALRLDPENVEAYNGLAVICVKQNRFDEARTLWEQALALDPGYETARENLRFLASIQSPPAVEADRP